MPFTHDSNSKNDAVAKAAEDIIESYWRPEYTQESISEFYKIIRTQFNSAFKGRLARTHAQEILARFIENRNEQDFAEAPLPLPELYTRIQRRPPVIDDGLLKTGRIVDAWTEDAIAYWSDAKNISPTKALGSFLFSAAVFGGLNSKSRLDALYTAIREDVEPLRIDDKVILPLTVESQSYGNVPNPNKTKSFSIGASLNFVLDDITLTWFWALRHRYHYKPDVRKRNAAHYLTIFFKALSNWQVRNQRSNPLSSNAPRSTIKTLMRGAPYVWGLSRCRQVPLWGITVAQDKTHSVSQNLQEWQAHCLPEPEPARVHDLPSLNVAPTSSARPIEGSNDRRFTRDLIQPIRNALKLPRQRCIQALEKLKQEPWHANERALIGYFIYEGVLDKWKTSTYDRYLDLFGHSWLLYSDELDLEGSDADEYLEVYEQCLADATDKDRPAARGRLRAFHQFLVDTYGALPVELEAASGVTQCRSAVMPVALYRWLLNSLLNADGEQVQLRHTLALILMLGYRCGLRAHEVCNIQMRDLFVHEFTDDSGDKQLDIYADIRRRLKTEYAYRRAPLTGLLPPSERQLLSKYYSQRRAESGVKSSVPLFCWLTPNTPIDRSVPNKALQKLLKLYPEPLPRYVFHGLRHTAFSNWMLMYFGEPDQIELFTDYTSFSPDVCRALVGDSHNPQEFLHAIAQVAGHATPGQTLESYGHWSHEMLGWKLSAVSYPIPKSFLNNVCGWSNQQIRLRFSGSKFRENELETLAFRAALAKATVAQESRPAASVEPTRLQTPAGHLELQSDPAEIGLPGMTTNPFTMYQVEKYLNQMAAGQHVEDLVSDKTQRKLLTRYRARAEDVFSRTSRNGKLRFVNELPGQQRTDVRLSPTEIRTNAERLQANRVLEQCYELFKSDDWRPMLYQQIELYLAKATATKTYIQFPKRECADIGNGETGKLYRWLTVLNEMFSDGEIRITGSSPRVTREKLEKFGLHENTSFKIDRRPDAKLAGFQVSIVMPGERQELAKLKKRRLAGGDRGSNRTPQSALSSGILKHLFPMLYITWPGNLDEAE